MILIKKRNNKLFLNYILFLIGGFLTLSAQNTSNPSLLDLDRIYNSAEFTQNVESPIQWLKKGNSYIIIEPSKAVANSKELVKYVADTQERSIFIAAKELYVKGDQLQIESFTLSNDETKVLIFTNSSRVWRSNSKGDYWIFDLSTKNMTQLGSGFESSSLMFAKFSNDNKYVAYVQGFNIYQEEFQTGQITQLTHDGTGDIINGTFDWVYEEEFGKRDGFLWSVDSKFIAYWHLDATSTGTFYMINNTDSIYSQPVPIRYPKVGQEPSAAKLGVLDLATKKTYWIPLEGGEKENYIPGMQWVNKDLLLIQQLNRKQNKLVIWTFSPSTQLLKKIYTETEKTWVDIGYPDISANNWGNNDLTLVDNGSSFLRMTENDTWRHVYKVNLGTGNKTLVTTGSFDVASMKGVTKKALYYIASPINNTQRYLYKSDLNGKGKQVRITPDEYSGVNNYTISPTGKFAIHRHQSATVIRTVRLIALPSHKTIKTIVDNTDYKSKLSALSLPEVRFSKVKTDENIEIDVRMILPIGFDANEKYPVLFHVYGEPWGQVAVDGQIGLWNIMMAQKGYVIVDMDNRGTPCLKGSEWRKSIYRQVGVINTRDQGKAAKELLKLPYLDNERTAVWGWSGGGTMTLNLMFKFPELYKTGIAVAAVSDQLIYDNIYQERYMGLPQENKADFVKGSPLTYAKNLEGNLLIIHGTADDNVHYQSAELIVNELISQNKQFQFMAYPNRSHGIYEGPNTRRHLYTLMTNYLLEHNPVNE